MKVYAIVGSRDYHGSSEPYGIYADEKRADAVCVELNAKSPRSGFPRYESYEVFEYEMEMK
jgi:hypothetical protein